MLIRHAPCVLFVAFTLALARPIPAEAQGRDFVTRERGVSADSFHSDLLRLVDVLQQIAVLAKDTSRHQRLEEARRMVVDMPPEQLDQFLSHGAPDLKPVLRANARLRALLAERVAALERTAEPQSLILPGRPPILGACNTIAHDPTFTLVALSVQQAADVALAAAGRGCDQMAVAFGFGANTALVCLPLETALTAAKIPLELADFCGGEEDSSFLEGSYDRLEHIHADLDENNQRLKSVQAVQRQIIRLLLTPEGRRAVDPAVLTCTGDDCPNVLACPGDECSFPVK
jgi:hypothetical protein